MIRPLYYRNTTTSTHRNRKPYTGLSLSLNSSVALIFTPVTILLLYNGNITECVQIRSVIIRVINKIERPAAKRKSDLLLRSMITDWIGRHNVMLPIYHNNYNFPLSKSFIWRGAVTCNRYVNIIIKNSKESLETKPPQLIFTKSISWL